MKKFLLILIAFLLSISIVITPYSEVCAAQKNNNETVIDSPDPEQILTDPDFDLNTVDPTVLDEWYASEVNVADANLQKALETAANVSSGDVLTVEDMFSLPTSLNLSGLSIVTLSGMEYAINVKELIVSNNSITNLEPLKDLYHLETINFSHNNVKIIPGWLFTKETLTEINASVNSAAFITSISGTSNLETLYLEGNKFDELPDMSGCTSLTILSLADNQFEELPQTIASLTQLESLSLANNQITSIEIADYKKLKILDLSNNNLSEIPQGIESLSSLEQLKLDFNQISKIPDRITTMANLKSFSISFNDITEMPDSIVNMTGLKVLNISVNYLDLTAQAELVQTISEQIDTFSYKLQKPNFILSLMYDKEAPAGKLVWSGIEEINDETEGYITITKFVIERKEETIQDESATDDAAVEVEEDTIPVIKFYEMIAEVDATTREYIDETADPEKDYTYRVTVYITGMYMNDTVIDTTGSETVNTADMVKPEFSLNDYIEYIAIGVVLLAVAVVLFIVLSRRKKYRKKKNKKISTEKADDRQKNGNKKKKRKKIKVVRSTPKKKINSSTKDDHASDKEDAWEHGDDEQNEGDNIDRTDES